MKHEEAKEAKHSVSSLEPEFVESFTTVFNKVFQFPCF